MERRRWLIQMAGLSLMGVCAPVLALPNAGRRLAVIGVSAGGSRLVEQLEIEKHESDLFAVLRRPARDVEGEMASIRAAARQVGPATDVLLVACLGGRFAGPMALCLSEHLARRGRRVHLFVTLPFSFEGCVRRRCAMAFAKQLSKSVHTLYALNLAVLLEQSPSDALFSSVLDEVGHRLFELYLRLSS